MDVAALRRREILTEETNIKLQGSVMPPVKHVFVRTFNLNQRKQHTKNLLARTLCLLRSKRGNGHISYLNESL